MDGVKDLEGDGAVQAVVDLVSLPLIFDIGGLGGVGVDYFHHFETTAITISTKMIHAMMTIPVSIMHLSSLYHSLSSIPTLISALFKPLLCLCAQFLWKLRTGCDHLLSSNIRHEIVGEFLLLG